VRYNSSNSWGWLDYAEPEIKKSLEIVTAISVIPWCQTGHKRLRHGPPSSGLEFPFPIHTITPPVMWRPMSADAQCGSGGQGVGVGKVVHTPPARSMARPLRADNEEHPLHGQSPYAASKIGADQLAMSFYLSFNTPVAIIRPFNTYGPRQSARR